MECQIISEQFMGTTVTLFLEAPGGEELKVQIGQRELEQIDISGGKRLFASWPAARAHVFGAHQAKAWPPIPAPLQPSIETHGELVQDRQVPDTAR